MNRLEYEKIVAYHPGYYVKEMIEELNMTQEELAIRLDTSAKNVSELINGKVKLSSEIAQKLATVFGTSVVMWLNLQQTYTEKELEILKLKKMEKECELARLIDYSFFVNLNLLSNRRKIEDKVEELLKFFKVSSLEVLIRKDFLVQYKTAVITVEKKNIINANAWVQTALNIGSEVTTSDFDEKKLKASLTQIREMTLMQPDEFLDRLRKLLSDCGVAFVLMPNLKNSGINGAVKWQMKDKVIVAVNDRRKYADIFWFALFHELGHVFQKKRKILFVADKNFRSKGEEELINKLESDADRFAQNFLIDTIVYNEFVEANLFTRDKVNAFANSNKIHPGIVVGRLQRDGLIQFNQLNDLREKYSII